MNFNHLQFYNYLHISDEELLKKLKILFNQDNVNTLLNDNFTPVMPCVAYIKPLCVQWLLSIGADLSINCDNGQSVLGFLSSSRGIDNRNFNNYRNVLQFFIDKNYDFNTLGYDDETALEQLVNTFDYIPSDVFIKYLHRTDYASRKKEKYFDILSEILFSHCLFSVDEDVIDEILKNKNYDINYSHIVTLDDMHSVYERQYYNFASSIFLLTDHEFIEKKEIIQFIIETANKRNISIDYDINFKWEYNNQFLDIPIILHAVMENNHLAFEFYLEQKPELINKTYDNKDITQFAVEYNNIAVINYLQENNIFDYSKTLDLIEHCKHHDMQDYLKSINAGYMREKIENDLNQKLSKHSKRKI